MCNVNVVPDEFSTFLGDTHASKVKCSTLERILFEILISPCNIIYIITTIYTVVQNEKNTLAINHQ